MLYTVIVFIAGMIFTGDTAKSYYLAYTTIFSHTMDYILGISIASLHEYERPSHVHSCCED